MRILPRTTTAVKERPAGLDETDSPARARALSMLDTRQYEWADAPDGLILRVLSPTCGEWHLYKLTERTIHLRNGKTQTVTTCSCPAPGNCYHLELFRLHGGAYHIREELRIAALSADEKRARLDAIGKRIREEWPI